MAAVPASAPWRDRGRVRVAPEQAPRKVLLIPSWLPLACRGQESQPPYLSALPAPSSKETIIIALLAWWGRT